MFDANDDHLFPNKEKEPTSYLRESGRSQQVFTGCSNITVYNDSNDLDKSVDKIVNYFEKKDAAKSEMFNTLAKTFSELILPILIKAAGGRSEYEGSTVEPTRTKRKYKKRGKYKKRASKK